MNPEEIENKVKDFFDKAKSKGKSAIDKAGDKVQDFSDKSVVRIEKRKLESSLEKKYQEFGKKCYELMQKESFKISESEASVNLNNDKKEIEDLLSQIKQKEDLLN